MAELKNSLPDFEPYKRLIDVPEEWRTLKGGVLSLDQINLIVEGAHEASKTSGSSPNVELAHVRQDFMQDHELVDGFWTKKGSN